MKYVIEINEHAMNDPFTPALYRAKGFKTLVFDEYGLSKLTPINDVVYSMYTRGYENGKKDADMEGYDRGYDSGYAQCKEDTKCGYDEGVEAGKKAMKEIVINNLTKFMKGEKFKPEVVISDPCDDCIHKDKPCWENPCNVCKHSHKDCFERKAE